MKNPPRPTPGFRRTEEFPDESWSFYFRKNCEQILENGWEAEMLFYELCKELAPDAFRVMDYRSYLSQISNDRFPDIPFLALEKHEREAIVRTVRERQSVFQWVRRVSTRSIFHWEVKTPFKDSFTRCIDNAADMAAAEEAAKHEGLRAEDFMPGTCPGDRAARAETMRILEHCSDPFDNERCTLTLHLDLDHHVDDIRKEFNRVLEQIENIKKSQSGPEGDPRGRPKNPHSHLRSLAAFRLKRQLGSYEKVGDFLGDNRFPEMDVKVARWNKLVKEGAELVEEFRSWVAGTAPDGVRLEPFRMKNPE